MRPILDMQLASQLDLSATRQRTRQIAAACGFGVHEQTRLATAISEMARSAIERGRAARVAFGLLAEGAQEVLVITLIDTLADAPAGRVDDGSAAMPDVAGLAAAHRFMDRVEIDRAANRIRLYKSCPRTAAALDAGAIERLVDRVGLRGDVGLAQADQRNRDLANANDSIALLNGQLNTRAETLLSADRRKDEFLAILAHELRGPLSALAMAGQMLEKAPNDPERAARLGQLVVRQTGHMTRIVEDLLDVSRIVRNEVAIERVPFDLREAVGAAVEQLTAAAARRRHAVVVRLPDAAVVVQGDRTRLVQVCGNLLANAIRYTPEGGRIEVDLAPRAGQACLSVRDNGIGISAALLPTLFDLFVQAERSTDSRNSGLGLGLALVKTLVEAHGGTVTVYSDGPGRGSRFAFCLPLLPDGATGTP
jgi:signal transduction histidine kinase